MPPNPRAKQLPRTHDRPALADIKESLKAIEDKVEEGYVLYPYEQGVLDTLKWVLGKGDNPNEIG